MIEEHLKRAAPQHGSQLFHDSETEYDWDRMAVHLAATTTVAIQSPHSYVSPVCEATPALPEGGLPMQSTDTRAAVAALLMLTLLISGCVEGSGTGTRISQDDVGNASSHPQPPFAGEAEVVTGTSTPHKQKNTPIEIERISDKQLEQSGAIHLDQVLQDVPGLQQRR